MVPMKKVKHFPIRLIVLFSMFFGLFASAQTERQANKITATYNQEYLNDLAAQSLQISKSAKEQAVQYAISRNIPITYTTKDGGYAELQRILEDGTPIYYRTNNKDAAHSTRTDHLNIGGSTGYNLDGQNMIAYVWDGGHPRVTHQEYDGIGGNNRVSIIDSPITLHYHAAHVVGTIAASGVQPQAKGMAPQAKVRASEWNNDLSEATSAALNGMLLSNHSYGFEASDIPDQWFGAYQVDARDWDNLMFNAPYYLMVNSAGNDGTDNTSNASPLATGYDKLNGSSTAKNNLVVAASDDAMVDSNGNLISVGIGSFSSQGPTDDLRIKPDITGNGVGVYSTVSSSNTAYSGMSGTSMAAPNVTGTLLQLQQHYNNLTGNFMKAATLKGLALHTADDAGPVGPDAIWGWGLLNAKKAAETISQNGSGSLIQEMVIAQGQTIAITVDSDGINDLMASISWTDRPGIINTSTNSPIAALVNDLDIRVTKGASTNYPWRLTAHNTNDNNNDNTVDPYERIDVENASGTYTITISHKGTLVGGNQSFSLIVTGMNISCVAPSIPQNLIAVEVKGTSALISWDPIPASIFELRYRRLGASTWLEINDVYANNYTITGLVPNSNYEFQVRSKCPGGTRSAYSNNLNFTTIELTYCESGSLNPLTGFYISNVTLNTINNNSTESSYTDFTSQSTELVEGQTYTISIATFAIANYTTSYSVWIDYNQNERFDDAGEQIFTTVTNASTIASGSFTVPVGVIPRSTTMRVSMTNDPIPAGSCDIFDYGEVEDYSIILTRPHTDFVYQNSTWSPSNPAGVSTPVDNIHIVNGATTFVTDISAYNLKIDTGASLSVEKVLTIAGDINNNGNLVFLSSATATGELAELPITSTIFGDVTVQRYLKEKRSYRMLSSAVTTTTSIHDNWQEGATSNIDNPHPNYGTHITGSTVDQQNGFDGTATGNPSMFTVDIASQQFVPVTKTDGSATLSAGEPYLLFVRGDRSINLSDNIAKSETVLRAKGSLFTGSQTQNFASEDSGDFVMFGNPYQSTVDVKSVFASSLNVNPAHYYVYDPTLGNHGAYVTINLTGANDGTNTSGSAANKYLQPGQAAQVATLAAGPSSVIFNEDAKAPGNFTSSNRNAPLANNMLTVQLFTTENINTGGPMHDSFGIIFAQDHDNSLTSMDAIKPINFYENLGVDHDGTLLSLERRKLPEADELFQMYISGFQQSEYTLLLTVNGMEDIILNLFDEFTGATTSLKAGTNSYSFTVNTNDPLSVAAHRFSIRTEQRLGLNDNGLLAGIHLYPNPLNGNIVYINASRLNGEQVQVKINDLTGREIFNENLECVANTVTVPLVNNLGSGVYLVTVIHLGESKTYRLLKE